MSRWFIRCHQYIHKSKRSTATGRRATGFSPVQFRTPKSFAAAHLAAADQRATEPIPAMIPLIKPNTRFRAPCLARSVPRCRKSGMNGAELSQASRTVNKISVEPVLSSWSWLICWSTMGSLTCLLGGERSKVGLIPYWKFFRADSFFEPCNARRILPLWQ